jgi:undecaprenyl-diphosphatase
MDSVVEGISRLGAQWLWFIWPPIVVLLVLKHKLPSAVALAVVALGVYPWNDLLKSIFQRARPSGAVDLLSVQSFSFPSGHSMAAGAVFGMLALLAWRELPPRWRTPAIVICGLLMVLIALSRVYLNVHYPTDVLAGLLVGILWMDVVTLVWRVAAEWLRQRRAVTAST